MLSAASAALALVSAQAFAQYSNIDRVVIFGASLSDAGNSFVWLSDPANQACGTRLSVPPYDMLDDLNTPDGPYAKGGHHFSNGATWVEGMARYLALAGNARPALKSGGMKASNYAVGGARAVPFNCRFNLPDQVTAYVGDFPQTSPNTLVAIEIGGNDLRDALIATAGGGNPGPYIQNAVTGLFNAIVTLHSHGARKFLLANVPNLARAPAVVQLNQMFPGIGAGATLLTMAYNEAFAGVVQFANSIPGVEARVLDLYATLETIVGDAASFGFANTTDACVTPNQPPFSCTNPDEYVFWDGIHPTKATHAIIAQRAIATISAP
jgi:phospholipase/lecithinase/hemolysin